MAFNQPFEVIGFHSCDREVGMEIIKGNNFLLPSKNEWDWLGNGIYFWEQNPRRALQYAEENAAYIQYNKRRITTPFVVGAIIDLGNCLNLVEPNSIETLRKAYEFLRKVIGVSERDLPKNDGPKRNLDCAVIKCLHEMRRIDDDVPFDTIRCPFHESELLYPTANFSTRLHIEICVVNPEKIKGYFLPIPIEEYNPYFIKEFHKEGFLRK